MVHDSIVSCVGGTPLVRLRRLFPFPGLDVVAKLEMLNPGGSVKDRPARFIVEAGLKDGTIRPGSRLVESSSGNLGIALAMVARAYGLRFTCVVDPKIAPANLRILRHLGADIDVIREKDGNGGYLGTRIRRVKDILKSDPAAVWINQYANDLNWKAHYHGEAEEIARELGRPIDCLVVAVSTTGTIHGLARGLKRLSPGMRVVAVDAAGSILFPGPPARRELPGMGASRVPELFHPEEIDEAVHVDDRGAVRGCRDLARAEGIFAGGSSGAVVAAIRRLLPRIPRPACVVTVLADRGDRYLDMVWDEDWVEGLQGPAEELALLAGPDAWAARAGTAGSRENAPEREAAHA